MSNNEEKNEQIINTEAAKAKVNEVAGNVKEGAKNVVDKIKTDKTAMYACIGAAVVVVVVIALLICFGGGAKKVAKTYSKSYVKQNAKGYCKTLAPAIIEEEFDDVDTCVEQFEDYFDDVEDDDKVNSYEIKSSKTLDKDDVEEYAEDLADEYDMDEDDLKKVVRFSVDFDAKGKDNDQKLYIFVGKIKGHWYVIDTANR